MSITVELITDEQVQRLFEIEEGQFFELKATDIEIAKLTRTISAFANSDGGELYIGIAESEKDLDLFRRNRAWSGFPNQEAANAHLQVFEEFFPLSTDYQYDFLKNNNQRGLVLHVQVNRTKGIARASNNIPYIRRGAQNIPQGTPELLKRLEYDKGVSTFESQIIDAPKEIITDSDAVRKFIKEVIPTTTPEPWLKKQTLIRDEKPTIAGVVLYADEPQAFIPKHCGVKISRYKTTEAEGFRDALEFTPKTVEGHLYQQIHESVKVATEIVEKIPKMGEADLERITYPPQTLHEIITNALIHRDYSIADDVHIRIFDNRIEVQSPGRLPAHITVKNILDERYARNGAIVRLLNKFPNPPNQDVGEGLNTAFAAMYNLGLKEPKIFEKDNSVLVVIKHEPLASPQETIMDYLENHPTINNRGARHLTHIASDYKVKVIFRKMVQAGMIEQVPGTKTSNICYQKVSRPK